jgi:hypothetical protein
MRAFMDEVTFNDAGNQVTLVKRWEIPSFRPESTATGAEEHPSPSPLAPG